MSSFAHLHSHTQYSLLDGASDIAELMAKASLDGQKAIAMTDHGNMFGAFKFVAEAEKAKVKPIVGCEFYMVEDRRKNSFLKSQGEKDVRHHQLLLAKNAKGYENLSKLCSLGYIEGIYGKFPRIDKELLEQYHEGLIATSCCLAAEIPQALLKGNPDKAEKLLKWWIDLFGKDYYIELQRHRGLENIDQTGVSQEDINQQLIGLAKKYDLKIIATNDSHYVEEDDWKPHDVLLCVNTGSKKAEEMRFKFPSTDFYFKTQDEMKALFTDVPDAVFNTMEIADKVEPIKLARDILLPNFPLPSGFNDQSAYLRHLVYQGAKVRYGELTSVITDRLDLELGIIKEMGFDGYFLIVQDFIKAAREINVSVGPGRGSAAGSAVAYALTITNLDPIEYNLLFERFLNPERISMPDIDIDFDDEGRQRVIDWVVDKYGKSQVAQIVTFGTMAARSSIRDVGRVLDLPLSATDRLAKMVPARPGTKLKKILTQDLSDLKKEWPSDQMSEIVKLRDIEEQTDLEGEVMSLAKDVEGSVRNTGIHAAGIIIAPDDITKYIPVCTSKESELYVTQFDGSVVESAGMLKMDFLGLKTLSIIKDAIKNIQKSYPKKEVIDPDLIPLDDVKTFELFQKGEMFGIFQFESEGMRKYLKELKPTSIEDLIAMNALYRPGPMDYIPSFIRRKHGKEPVEYPHVWLEEILKPTYGIMVYQEQIMQTAQIMADYSLGKADILRRAMGKKKASEMNKQRVIFIKGATEKGVDEKNAEEVFDIMAKFAQYGFNRSHSAAYSVLAFHTAYLKTHYPAEFMAAVLTHNKSDLGKLNIFLRECKRMGIDVKGPNVNESELNFTVNKKGAVVFGLSALKGVGEGPVSAIVEERTKGLYGSIYDMTKRLNLRAINKKCMESLALGGAFDLFGHPRATYFAPTQTTDTILEHSLKYGNAYKQQQESSKNSLFGDLSDTILPDPDMPEVEEWSVIEKLTKEKSVTGIFISGHPLDDYKLEIESFTNCKLEEIVEDERELKIAGLVTDAFHGTNAKGIGYGKFTIQDYTGSFQFSLNREQYQKNKDLLEVGQVVFVEGTHRLSYNGDRYFFRMKELRLLDSISRELTKSITISIPVSRITTEMVDSLNKVITKHKGKHLLKMDLLDYDKKIKLSTVSSGKRVKADTELAKGLEAIGLEYKLN